MMEHDSSLTLRLKSLVDANAKLFFGYETRPSSLNNQCVNRRVLKVHEAEMWVEFGLGYSTITYD